MSHFHRFFKDLTPEAETPRRNGENGAVHRFHPRSNILPIEDHLRCQGLRDHQRAFLPGGIDPEIKNGAERVFRGGSSLHLLNACGSGKRDKFRPSYQSQTVGFRLAAVPSGE